MSCVYVCVHVIGYIGYYNVRVERCLSKFGTDEEETLESCANHITSHSIALQCDAGADASAYECF